MGNFQLRIRWQLFEWHVIIKGGLNFTQAIDWKNDSCTGKVLENGNDTNLTYKGDVEQYRILFSFCILICGFVWE